MFVATEVLNKSLSALVRRPIATQAQDGQDPEDSVTLGSQKIDRCESFLSREIKVVFLVKFYVMSFCICSQELYEADELGPLDSDLPQCLNQIVSRRSSRAKEGMGKCLPNNSSTVVQN